MDFTAAHEHYLPFVRTVVSTYPEPERDDLVQEGLWGLYLGVCAYDPSRSVPFDAFVKVCIRNRILSAARGYERRAGLVSLDDLDGTLTECGPSIEERYAESDAFQDLLRKVRPRLSELEKNVLDRYLSGKSVRTAAEELSISPKSADNAMTRIKSKIRELLPY